MIVEALRNFNEFVLLINSRFGTKAMVSSALHYKELLWFYNILSITYSNDMMVAHFA